MCAFHVSLESEMIPRFSVSLGTGIGLLLQASVASRGLNGRSEKSTVDDLGAEQEEALSLKVRI